MPVMKMFRGAPAKAAPKGKPLKVRPAATDEHSKPADVAAKVARVSGDGFTGPLPRGGRR